MKSKGHYLLGILITIYSVFSFSAILPDSKELLSKMRETLLTGNYELIFTRYDINDNETLRYRHIVSQKKQLAQLLYMDGPTREILLRGKEIGYFGQDREAFSLKGKRIVEVFPDIIYSDFDKLNQHYEFISVGRGRVSNKISQIIRIIDKDHTRYGYVVWIDEQNYFPLRIDLIDDQGDVLEQFKTVLVKAYQDADFTLDAINNIKFPSLLESEINNQTEEFKWQVNWLPAGMKKVSQFSRKLKESDIETILFSDGAFSFTVSVSSLQNKLKNPLIRQGVKIIYARIVDDKEITIIGDLPVETAKSIASQVTLTPSS